MKQKLLTHGLAFAALLILGAAMTAPDAGAQSSTVGTKSCFVRDTNPRNKAGKLPEIPATSKDAVQLLQIGYQEVTCTLTPQKITDFQVQICRLSALNNLTVNTHFSAIYSISPAQMCVMLNDHVAAK
jgi:hypothetical protein